MKHNRQHIKKSRDTFANKGPSSKSYGFSSSRVWIWVGLQTKLNTELMLLDCSVGEDSWESLGQKGDPTTVNPKGNQSWMFIGRTNAEAETLWPPVAKSLTHWKRFWCWERLKAGREGNNKNEMVGWHQRLDGHEFE